MNKNTFKNKALNVLLIASRIILLIPSILLVMIVSNILYELFIDLIRLIVRRDSTPFDFIYDSFLKSLACTLMVGAAAMFVYPFKNKVPSIIVVSLIYGGFYLSLYELSNSDFYGMEAFQLSKRSTISVVSAFVGNLISIYLLFKSSTER